MGSFAGVAGLLGCSDGDDGQVVVRTVGPEGGLVSSHDEVLTLFFPAGSVSRRTEIRIAPSDVPPLVFGPAYRVQPDIDLEIPVEVTYRRVLPRDPTGTTVGAIRRTDFEQKMGSWVRLPQIEIDLDNDLVTSTDTELSLFYALLEGEGVSSGSGPATGTGGDDEVGDDEPSDAGGDTTGGPSGSETGVPMYSYAQDIQPIWDAHCVDACHEPPDQGGNPAAIILLHDESSYDRIVDVFAATATIPYVTPGEPSESYLMHKLDGSQTLDPSVGGCDCNGGGSTMPSGAPQLDLEVRNRVRSWIEQGAMP